LLAARLTETNTMLLEAFARRGVSAWWQPAGGRQTAIGTEEAVLGRLDLADTVTGAGYALRELAHYAERGLHVLIRPATLVTAHDRWLTAHRLSSLGVPHPRTALIVDEELRPPLAPPLAVTSRFGSWSAHVEVCGNGGELQRCLRRLRRHPWYTTGGALAREHIPGRGHDLRLVVAHDRVVGAVRRAAAPDQCSSTIPPQARRVEAVPAPAARVAVAAAAALQADLLGVHLRQRPDGTWTVIELNAAAEFSGDYSLHGENVFDTVTAALLSALAWSRLRTALGAAPAGP
jgi:[lysine-biosynthesis-protein LysW]--L-2-aminoadipate ligase